MTTRLGTKMFLSYRGADYPHVAHVRRWLTSTGLCKDVKFVEPQRLALDHELMLPFELLELMMVIWNQMEECDAFAFLSSPDYMSSVWTELEVTGWRFFSGTPIGHAIGAGAQGYEYATGGWPAMPTPEKRMWIRLRMNLDPVRSKSSRMIPHRGGTYATRYYLLPCRVCGEYSLLARSAVESLAKRSGTLACGQPACGSKHRLDLAGTSRSMRYRVPIVAVPLTDRRANFVRALEVEEITQLYTDSKRAPPGIAVVSA
jgi:hypothetical protein